MASFKYCGFTKAELNKVVKDKILEECEKETLRYIEYLDWDFNDDCPYCGCQNHELNNDFIEENDGSHHDIIDCPKCGRRLYYETYE